MSTVAARLPQVTNPRGLIPLAGLLLTASLIGVGIALNVPIGIALLLGLVYLAIAMSNLQLGLALWLPLIFLEGLPAFNLGAKAAGLLIIGVWFATLGRRREHVLFAIRTSPVIWTGIAGLLVWYSLSLLWATDTGMVFADLWHWYAVALLALIVATTVSDRRVLGWMLIAFVVGATLTVTQGIVSGGLSTSATAIDTAAEGRLEGGQGDPNFLAAGIVPAIIIVLGLFTALRGRGVRWWLMIPLAILALGLAASESRGGALAALAAVVAAMFAFRNRRAEVLAVVALVVGVAAIWFSVAPSAWERVTDFDSGGSGRDELWEIAWRMSGDNVAVGVGLNNFPVVSKEYVSEPGSLERLDLIVDRAKVVHNAFLQLLAETGVIGLALFLLVAVASLSAAWRAAGRFREAGDAVFETAMHGVVVAMVALLAASFFVSNGVDKRLWVLFGLGPASLAVATRAAREDLLLAGDDADGRGSDGSGLGGRVVRAASNLPAAGVALADGPGRGPSNLPRTLTSRQSTDDAHERFLDVAAIEMRRMQETAERARDRLQKASGQVLDGPADEFSETVELLMNKNAEIAEECARVADIVQRVSRQ